MAINALEHRRFLAQPGSHRPFDGTNMLARIGGTSTIEVLVDTLYTLIGKNTDLRSLFGRDMERGRQEQKRFFLEWLGGAPFYSDTAYVPLKHRHDLIPITKQRAEQWLACFRDAIMWAVPDAEACALILHEVRALAFALINEKDTPTALRAHTHGTCLRYRPAADAIELARAGKVDALRVLLAHAPDVLASVPLAAKLMHLAVLSGRTPVVALLIERDVDVDKPSSISLTRSRDDETLVFVTPLCAARLNRRTEITKLLLQHGAQEDVFTHAFLGDIGALQEDIAHDPGCAQVRDPAVDVLDITPLHHAVAGGSAHALQVLLTQAASAADPIRGLNRSLRVAVAHEQIEMVATLLQYGAAARDVGPGRWVMNENLASMLTGAGARIDRSGSWIPISCTGNQGRRDDPAYVSALLRHGGMVNDRFEASGSALGRPTALHCSARAGFLQTIKLLLDHGADPDLADDLGRTPRDWVEQAAKTVDREAVRHLFNL